jgi:hypothetical protein
MDLHTHEAFEGSGQRTHSAAAQLLLTELEERPSSSLLEEALSNGASHTKEEQG